MNRPKQSLAAVALVVRDYDEAKDYYSRVLGFDVIDDAPIGEGKRWLVVAPPGSDAQLVLAQASTPGQLSRIGNQTGGRVFLFLHTDDVQRDYQSFRERGVVFRESPRHESYGTVAVFQDLYGNLWDLIERGLPG
jgi:catechol 2,3-dioxygenase-like lactoylglutathione lyase family enzyme